MSNFCFTCRSPIDSDTCPICGKGNRFSDFDLPAHRQQEPEPQSEVGDPMKQPQSQLAKRVEVLGIKTAKCFDQPVALLAVRIGTLSRAATSLYLTAPQARRLLDDLTQLFTDPEMQDAAGPLDHESRIAFERIMQDEPRSTVDRSGEAE